MSLWKNFGNNYYLQKIYIIFNRCLNDINKYIKVWEGKILKF